MKISDYIFNCIAELGVKDVFFLPGGGAMHLNNSLGQNKRLNAICMLHEQAAAIAAEAYARISGGYGVCLITSGPGSTNAVTGLAGAYLDSTPVIFISGQAKRGDLVGTQGIRQFGIQEVDIVSVVKPITKYCVQITDEKSIRYELHKATLIARNGRPGPVWIDIPLDIQAMDVEPDSLPDFNESGFEPIRLCEDDVEKTLTLLKNAKRPVLLLGHGVRLAGAVDVMRTLVEKMGIPVLTTWNGADLIEENHHLYFGRPGAVGQRYANFVQQNADFVLSIGTRLNLLSTGFDYDSFLRSTVHVMVDIDANEMNKKSVRPALRVQADAGDFIAALLEKESAFPKDYSDWIARCREWKRKYSLFIPEQNPREEYVSPYALISEISEQMKSEDIYQFTSSGVTADIAMQTFRFKKGQRGFLTKGLASMGFDIPACIGSCIASGGEKVVCVTGDGGFMMNIQELAVLKYLSLPVKLFVSCNGGYGMIYNSQFNNFDGHLTGCDCQSGLPIPDIGKIAASFGIPTFSIIKQDDLAEKVCEVLQSRGPAVCTVITDIAQKILPRQSNYVKPDGQMASRPLEDMVPLLSEDELRENMIVLPESIA